MPIDQKFSMNTGDAYEGMVYGLRTAMSIRTGEAHGKPGFGQAVKARANTERGVEPATGDSLKKDCYGILVRQVNHEAALRPSLDGSMDITDGELVGLMVEGQIMVKLKAAVQRDQSVTMDSTTKTWEHSTTVADNFSNVVALQAGSAGDTIPVRIFQVAQGTAATK